MKVQVVVDRLKEGHRSGLKAVGGGVWEWRIQWGPGVRIYLGFDDDELVILLGGGVKSRQDLDIAKAKNRWQDYKARKES